MTGNLKDIKIEEFNDTMKLCSEDKDLKSSIEKSLKAQSVILEGDIVDLSNVQVYDSPAKIVVSKKRSFEAAKAYKDNKVCVLNFASATNAGGGVKNGSSAQEESLCRCSTLYPCISSSGVVSEFHDKHRDMLKNGDIDATYNDDCIYTPDVTVFKSDTNSPMLLSKVDWYKVDVISCAAPNLRKNPSNRMNPNSGSKQIVLKPSELLNLHMKRISRVVDIAKSNGIEVLILGAFENSPQVVAEAMARVLKENLKYFKVIEFAVYCTPSDTTNFDTFNRRLSKLGSK